MTTTAPRTRLFTAFAAVYFIWGSTYLAIRFAIETMPPFLMAGARFVLAGGILVGWQKLAGAPWPRAIHWREATVIGALMLLGGNGGVCWAEQTVPSGLTCLLISTVPLWMTLLLWLGPGRVRPGPRALAGLVLGLGGVALLVGPGSLAEGGIDPAGAVVLVAATISWAIGSLYSRRARLPELPLLAVGLEMLAGGVLLVAAGSVAGEWPRLDPARVSVRSALSLGYLVLFGSIVAFTAYIWLLKATSPARATTYAFVNPVVAMLLGWGFAGESITPRTSIAAAVIITAVILIIGTDARRRTP